MDKSQSLKLERKKVLIPIIIRAIIFLISLAIKKEIYGIRISLIIIVLLLIWSRYDFMKNRKIRKNRKDNP